MRPGDPSLGVVVAAWNAERWLGETLRSLCSQRFRDFACVVVDDGSTDRTAEVASVRDDRVRVVRRPHAGQAAARNAGVDLLPPSVDLVAFLDADDTYTADGLTSLVGLLRRRPDAVGAFGLAEYVDGTGTEIRPGVHPARQRDRRAWVRGRLRPVPPGADSTFADLVEYGPAWPSLVGVYRIAAVRAIGGFDERLGLREDWDLQLRLSRHGPIAAYDGQVAWYRRHGANLTAGVLLDAVRAEQVLAKAVRSPDNSRRQALVCRLSVARRRAGELAKITRSLRAEVGRKDVAAVARTVVALGWTASLLLRTPGVGSRRRVWWSHGLPADADDLPWEA